MNLRTRLKLTIEDESCLEEKIKITAPAGKWLCYIACGMFFFMAVGAVILSVSPFRRALPGFLKDSERTASEMQHLRIDSLMAIVNANQQFIDNILQVLSPVPNLDTIASPSSLFSSDTLLPTSAEEKHLLYSLREREKYNISVVAPLAAESMMFNPLNEECVVKESTKSSPRAEMILARGATVSAIADGKVISVSQSLREGGGAAVIIQHPKGFLSRLSRLGFVMVEPGDEVTGGQVIAVHEPGNSRKDELVIVEMWHNGTPLIPFDYIGDSKTPASRYPAPQ